MSERLTAPKVEISYVKDADFRAWLPHWEGYQRFYKVTLTPDITKTTWSRFIAPDEDVHCIVAKINGEIVGFAHFLFHLSTWAESEYCYLEDLYVSPVVRGQQIGKQLIAFLTEEARRRNGAKVYWHTQETNHTAQRLYDWIAMKPGMIKYDINLRQTL